MLRQSIAARSDKPSFGCFRLMVGGNTGVRSDNLPAQARFGLSGAVPHFANSCEGAASLLILRMMTQTW